MIGKRGFTLAEMLVVMIIVGILIAVTLPAFVTSIEQTKAQAAQNNLLAIEAGQSKYYEDYGYYCINTPNPPNPTNPTCVTTSPALFSSLGLTPSGNDPFQYSCSTISLPYTCTATDNIVTLTLNPNSQPPVTCNPVNSNCPSTI